MDVLALLLRKQIAGILVAYHGTWKYFSKGILVKFKCLQKSTCLDAQNLSARSLAENYGVFSACSSHLKSYYGDAVKDEKKTPIKKKTQKHQVEWNPATHKSKTPCNGKGWICRRARLQLLSMLDYLCEQYQSHGKGWRTCFTMYKAMQPFSLGSPCIMTAYPGTWNVCRSSMKLVHHMYWQEKRTGWQKWWSR